MSVEYTHAVGVPELQIFVGDKSVSGAVNFEIKPLLKDTYKGYVEYGEEKPASGTFFSRCIVTFSVLGKKELLLSGAGTKSLKLVQRGVAVEAENYSYEEGRKKVSTKYGITEEVTLLCSEFIERGGAHE